jgi:hypothetical protein
MESMSMAINWLIALKAIPWSELAQAAPHIVKGARTLFTTARGRAGAGSGAGNATNADLGAASLGIEERLRQVETAAQALQAEQRATADVLRSLAEQNARVVEAIAVLQARLRILLGLSILLILALVVLAAWVLAK